MPDREDSGVSRRSVLRGAAGVGAAGIAATALTGMADPAPATAESGSRTTPASGGQAGDDAAGETIVAHVVDAASGEIDIYRGTTHTRLRDRELAARLVRASR